MTIQRGGAMNRGAERRIRLAVLLAGCLLMGGCGGYQKPRAQMREVSVEELDALAVKLRAAEAVTVDQGGLWITEETIAMPGVQRDYDILFITDTHAMEVSEEDPDMVREYQRVRRQQMYGRENGADPGNLEDWVSYANAVDADAVFLGGDIIDCPSRGNLDYLETQLGRLKMPYLYTLGNHDWTFPWEYMTEKGRELYLPQLQEYMGGDAALHTWETEDLLAVAVDDSPGQINAGIRGDTLERYRELLEKGKPVILLMHVPLLTQSALERAKKEWPSSVVLGGGNYGGIYPNETSGEFIELTTAADSPVELALSGHLHFYDRDDIEGERKILQLVGNAGFQGGGVMLHIRKAEAGE